MDAWGHSKLGWCFVPNGHLVAGDVMLAQKIALETSENSALAVANKFPPNQATFRASRRRLASVPCGQTGKRCWEWTS
jgi:hypothetical protein